MKVLEKGSGQKGWSAKFKCTGAGNGNGGCGALLLVEIGDVYETSRGYYDGSTDYFRTFTCGECGVQTDIPEKHWPPGAVQSLRQWQTSRKG